MTPKETADAILCIVKGPLTYDQLVELRELISQGIENAVGEEREKCAKLAESDSWAFVEDSPALRLDLTRLAEAIRRRE